MAKDIPALQPVSFRLPGDLIEKARKKSEETGVSLSFVVRKAIEAWVSDDVKDQKKGR